MSDPTDEGSELAALAREGRERRASRDREASRPLRERNAEASASVYFSNALPSHAGWGVLGVTMSLACMLTTGMGVWAPGWIDHGNRIRRKALI